MSNAFTDHWQPPQPHETQEQRAHRLGVSIAALELLAAAEVIDLHIDTFIPVRLWGYDVRRWHGPGLLRGKFFGHLDLPRMRDGGLGGAMWSLTTNPLRTPEGRWSQLQRNYELLQGIAASSGGELGLARDVSSYRAVRATGAMAVLAAIQGGHALEDCPDLDEFLGLGWLTRITLIHLIDAVYGATSSPLRRQSPAAITHQGIELIEAMDRNRVFVDLAHIARPAFWQAVAAHDAARPLLATHTGVDGVTPHWRNLDDEQLRAIAGTGGVVGIIFAANFLKTRQGPQDLSLVITHLEHVIRVAGVQAAALGSDYDGAIMPPPGLADGLGYPRLVEAMLRARWPETQILQVLGGNFLRAFAQLRP